jgi:hypothetical protein
VRIDPARPEYNVAAPCGAAGPAPQGTCRSLSRVQLVRYEIAPEQPTVPMNVLTNPPCLWRSEQGRRELDGTVNAGPYVGNDPLGNPSPWQMVARGIDDMQVQYLTACPSPGGAVGWCNVPGAVVGGNLNTVVQQVRVTLSARAIGSTVNAAGQVVASLGGESVYAPGGTAGRRGQLTTTIAPRAALMLLSAANPGQWR